MRACSHFSSLVNAYLGKGNAYVGLDQFQQAIQDYDETIMRDPQYILAYVVWGAAHAALGNSMEEARASGCSV